MLMSQVSRYLVHCLENEAQPCLLLLSISSQRKQPPVGKSISAFNDELPLLSKEK